MKGQFFLISGAVVVIVLLLIKSSLNLAQIIENKRSLEVSMERKEFLNIKDQLVKTIEYSYNKNETEKIENFLRYVKGRSKAKAIELEGIAIEAFYRNVSAGSGATLNLTVFNFLGEMILSLNLSFNGSTQTFSNLADGSSRSTSFNFVTSSDFNYTLLANYSTFEERGEYSIDIPVELGKSKLIAFFDLKLIGLRGEFREEFSKVVDLA